MAVANGIGGEQKLGNDCERKLTMNEAVKTALDIAQTLLEGVTAPFGVVIGVLLPLLIELSTHQGKLSKKFRLELQDKLDDLLKPFTQGA
jgi:hypothetical protein